MLNLLIGITEEGEPHYLQPENGIDSESIEEQAEYFLKHFRFLEEVKIYQFNKGEMQLKKTIRN